MISPTPGRDVWYYPAPEDRLPQVNGHPLAAKVVGIHDDDCVNLLVFDAVGGTHPRLSVRFCQPNMSGQTGTYCRPREIPSSEAAIDIKAALREMMVECGYIPPVPVEPSAAEHSPSYDGPTDGRTYTAGPLRPDGTAEAIPVAAAEVTGSAVGEDGPEG